MTIFDKLQPLKEYTEKDDNCVYKHFCVMEVMVSSKKEDQLYMAEYQRFLDKNRTWYDSSPLLPIFWNKIYLWWRSPPRFSFWHMKYVTTYYVLSNKPIIAERPFKLNGIEERMIYDCKMVPFLYNMIVIDFRNRYYGGKIDKINWKYHQDL